MELRLHATFVLKMLGQRPLVLVGLTAQVAWKLHIQEAKQRGTYMVNKLGILSQHFIKAFLRYWLDNKSLLLLSCKFGMYLKDESSFLGTELIYNVFYL